MRSIVLIVAVGLLLTPTEATAQRFEVGAGVSLSCEPFEESWCHQTWGRIDGVYGSWWASHSLAIELRGAHLEGPASRLVAVGERIGPHESFYRSYALRDEKRTLLHASVIYHFLHKRPVRPFVGGGPGVLWWRGQALCTPDLFECHQVLPHSSSGGISHNTWVLSAVGGVAVQPWRGLTMRGGVRSSSHPAAVWRIRDLDRRPNYLADALPEYFVSIGYRW